MRKSYEDKYNEYKEFFPIVNFCNEMNNLIDGKIKRIDEETLHKFNSEFERHINIENFKTQYDYILKNLKPIKEYKHIKMILNICLEFDSVCYIKNSSKIKDFHKRKLFSFIPFIECVDSTKQVEFLKKYLLEEMGHDNFEAVIFDRYQKVLIKNSELSNKNYPEYYKILKYVNFTKEEVIKKLKNRITEFPRYLDNDKRICKLLANSIGFKFNEFEDFVYENIDKRWED